MVVTVYGAPTAGPPGASEGPRRPEEQPGAPPAGEDGRGEDHHRWRELAPRRPGTLQVTAAELYQAFNDTV